MLHRRLLREWAFLISILIFLIQKTTASLIQLQDKCYCENGGQCQSDLKYSACNCPSGFIGTHCQTRAQSLSQKQIQAILTPQYTYFYFEPSETNYFQISLKVCLPPYERNKLTSLVFLEVEKSSGRLKLEPSIYQTSPISFDKTNDQCQTFYTHFIPIRKKLNSQYQKIIFGLAIKNNSDSIANRWVQFWENSLYGGRRGQEQDKTAEDENTNIEKQIERQKIIISCTYELYLVENYWGTVIIIVSSITLIISTVAFLYTIRNRYSYTISNEDILRIYAINPQEFAQSQIPKNDLTHFKFIMPEQTYSQYIANQKYGFRKHPKNFIKRKISMLKTKNQVQNKNTDSNEQFQKQAETTVYPSEHHQEEKIQKKSSFKNQQTIPTVQLETMCTICLLNFEGNQKIRRTPCRHVFHTECIDNWCETTLNCPMCRKSFHLPSNFSKKYFRSFFRRNLST